MVEGLSYAGLLRPIGQMLESLRIDSFAVLIEDDGFVVRDKTRNRTQLTHREKAFSAALDSSHPIEQERESVRRLAAGMLEWKLTDEDIERLELESRERRRDSSQTPDSYSISQLLRVIGMIVDQKLGRLVSLTKDEQTIVVEYLLPNGQKNTGEYTLPVLYDFWVRMYKKRGPAAE